jgi:hypothetical protein
MAAAAVASYGGHKPRVEYGFAQAAGHAQSFAPYTPPEAARAKIKDLDGTDSRRTLKLDSAAEISFSLVEIAVSRSDADIACSFSICAFIGQREVATQNLVTRVGKNISEHANWGLERT